ncbi:MAG TPA: acyloxyacyl hydrolase [Gemmatimonadaceae bacterium]|nr:acyloxyacyl hydrolase [Gemmatimonadaceae bacterium]
MRRTNSVAVLVAAALASLSVPCGAQSDTTARTSTDLPAPQSLDARPPSLSVWVQSGPASFHTVRLGGFAGARLRALGLRWHHTLHRSDRFVLASIPDLVVVSSLDRINDRRIVGEGIRRALVLTKDGHTHGVGTLPLGIRAALDDRKPLGAFVDVSAGLQYFFRAVPDYRATRLNAQLMAAAGLRSTIGKRVEAELAYRLLHISNGGTAKANPGLNFHQIAVGVGFRPHKR